MKLYLAMDPKKPIISKLQYLKMGNGNDNDTNNSKTSSSSFNNKSSDRVAYSVKSTESSSTQSSNQLNPHSNKKIEYSSSPHESESGFNVPGFLRKAFVQDKDQSQDIAEKTIQPAVENGDQKFLPYTPEYNFGQEPVNNFSSVFNNDHQKVFGIQRVFKKSITFLILHFISFFLLVIASINLFNLNILLSLFVSVLYIAITNIFYIVVADKNYVYLNILAQGIILLIVHAFLGLSFDKITLLFTLISLILLYFAYNELEKIQLGSRLFSIAHITSESTRIISTVVILILCLGVFNKAIFVSPENFVLNSFLDKPLVLNDLVIGKYKNLSLNRFLMKGKFYTEAGVVKSDTVKPDKNRTNLLFSDFLTYNYKPQEEIVTQERQDELYANCDKKVVKNCDTLIDAEREKNLDAWRKEGYSNLPYTLNTELTPTRFQEITKQYYVNEIKRFSESNKKSEANDVVDNLSKWLIMPKTYILPAVIAVVLFILLSIIKPILQWLAYLAALLIWRILKWVGFARIDVEQVEAEIVSI